MTYESYVNLVCGIVFTLFVVLFSILIGLIVVFKLRLISNGVEDDKIEKEYERKDSGIYRAAASVSKVLSSVLSLVILLFFLAAFAIAMYTNQGPDKSADKIPMIKVVMSESMCEKNIFNKYLYENELDDQFNAYDMVLIRALPPEEELELYDIVVYEIEEELIIHRIVGIEEPNEEHAERLFTLQGDAIHVHDSKPVTYSQMRGIYEGERVEMIGSFFVFMRSFGGALCLFLVITATLITPILEWRIKKAKEQRW